MLLVSNVFTLIAIIDLSRSLLVRCSVSWLGGYHGHSICTLSVTTILIYTDLYTDEDSGCVIDTAEPGDTRRASGASRYPSIPVDTESGLPLVSATLVSRSLASWITLKTTRPELLQA